MLGMQPVFNEVFSGGPFTLGDLIFVMRKRKVDSSSVNVQSFTQIFHGHRRTFNVPTGAARPNAGLPEMLAFLRRLPQREIASAFFFVAVHVHASAGLDAR